MATKGSLALDVFYEVLKCKSVDCTEEAPKFVNAIASEDWRAPIMAHLTGHYESQDEADRKRVASRARSYEIRRENLYRAGVCAPLLKCVSHEDGMMILQEIHAGM